MREWLIETPDGRRLVVHRDWETWVVRCDEGKQTRSRLLDIALIDAIRGDIDLHAHSGSTDYGAWTRGVADQIESEL
jgi:hypothetical protein